MRTQFGDVHVHRSSGKSYNYGKNGKHFSKNKSRFHAYLEETAEDESTEFSYDTAGGEDDDCYDTVAYYEEEDASDFSEYGGDMDDFEAFDVDCQLELLDDATRTSWRPLLRSRRQKEQCSRERKARARVKARVRPRAATTTRRPRRFPSRPTAPSASTSSRRQRDSE